MDVCERCGGSPTYYESHSCSCFSFVTQEMIDKAKKNGIYDPVLCEECLKLFITKFGENFMVELV